MPPEGMVHALKLVYDLLAPEGRLIDIHPTGMPPLIELVTEAGRFPLGYLQESDNFIEYAQADATLNQVVEREMFVSERQGKFVFITHAASVAELSTFLSENWADAILPPSVAQQASELEMALGIQGRIQLSEHVRITRLRPWRRPR
jgi:hypothetical protein